MLDDKMALLESFRHLHRLGASRVKRLDCHDNHQFSPTQTTHLQRLSKINPQKT